MDNFFHIFNGFLIEEKLEEKKIKILTLKSYYLDFQYD